MEENTEHQTLQAEFDTSPEPLAQPDTTPNHQCPKCQRVFTSEPALRMHHVRKHSGRGWSTAQNFQGKRTSMSREERLAKRRIYNRKWRLRKGMGVRPQSLTENKGGNKGMKLPKWSQQRLEKFRATMKRRATMKEKVKAFTDTRNNQEPGNNPGVNNPGVTFCPRCGCNIRNVAAAIAFGDKHQ